MGVKAGIHHNTVNAYVHEFVESFFILRRMDRPRKPPPKERSTWKAMNVYSVGELLVGRGSINTHRYDCCLVPLRLKLMSKVVGEHLNSTGVREV